MVFDIGILIIILVCMVFGFKNGLFLSIVRIFGWVIAAVAAIFLHRFVETFIIKHTDIYEKLYDRVLRVCLSFVDKFTGGVTGSAPGSVGETLDKVGNSLANNAAEQISKYALTIFVFIGILIIVKLILFVLTLILSKRHHTGFVGGVDGVLGLIFGVVQGVIIILVLLALIEPLSFVISAESYAIITKSLDNSFVAEIIYNNNPLLSIITGLTPADLNPVHWLNNDGGGFDIPNLKDIL